MGARRGAAPWRRLLGRFHRTRELLDHEWASEIDTARAEMTFLFFAERTPTAFELTMVGASASVATLEYGPPDDASPIDFRATKSEGDDGEILIVCEPVRPLPTRRAKIRLTDLPDGIRGRLSVRVLKEGAPDLVLIEDAHAEAARGSLETAVERLLEYSERYSAENASVSYWIADWSQRMGRVDRAEEYAARAVAHGNPEVCCDLYRAIRETRPLRPVEEFRQLQREGAGWSIGSQHGVVALERHQRHVLGLGGCDLHKVRETLEVRRPAAARMLSQLQFHFSRTHQLLLHTSLTVIHPDDTVEPLPTERFTVGDHESDNVFITLENEAAGHWILPDLAPGDIIEWTHDLLHRNRKVGTEPQTFSVGSLFHPQFATFRAAHEFVFPERLPVRFSVLNGDLRSSRESIDSRIVHTFHGERFVPARQTGFPYENHWLNPLIACASEGPDWSSVARSSRRTNFGEAPIEEDPPAPLAGLLEDGSGEQALERAFYWIRDKLRYAVVRSGAERIGTDDRGRRIVDAGVADCKDKSYLLALVCRRLGIPYEFLVVSTANGVLLEEMPADQFDHVFVRARTGDGWLYLDPANPVSTFGSAPAWCQGMKALVLGEPARILEIPVDHPSVNGLEIRERFEEFRNGRVAGDFEVTAEGQVARIVDERWKAVSLWMEDQLLAGQEGLANYLPGAIVDDYHRGAETSTASRFRVEGIHSRGPLAGLPRHGRVVLPLSWRIPTLPLGYWRVLQLDRLFVVDLPMTVRITLRIEGDVRRAVDDFSRVPSMENAIARVTEEVTEETDALEIRRSLTFERKIVRGEHMRLVRPTLEHFENALRMVVAWRSGEALPREHDVHP